LTAPGLPRRPRGRRSQRQSRGRRPVGGARASRRPSFRPGTPTSATSTRPTRSPRTGSATRPGRTSFQVAVTASPFATYACVDAWLTDFHDDLPKIDVAGPTTHCIRLPDTAVRDHRGTTARPGHGSQAGRRRGRPAQHLRTRHEEVNQALLEHLAS